MVADHPQDDGPDRSEVALALVAVILFWRVVLPRYRRNSWGLRGPLAGAHPSHSRPQLEAAAREWKLERTAEDRNTIADIHGTGQRRFGCRQASLTMAGSIQPVSPHRSPNLGQERSSGQIAHSGTYGGGTAL